MKIIFSRKGFDSATGGCPSPIIEGRPISLPIPTRMPTKTSFGVLRSPIPNLVRDLTGGRLTQSSKCHLDPDIDLTIVSGRRSNWRGALGQVAQAQQHLANQQVKAGDLFLFWGLFRAAEKKHGRWSFTGRAVHAIYGWLQIASIWSQSSGKQIQESFDWLSDHPHAQQGWGQNNTIYIARQNLKLGFETGLPGFGVLRTPFILTATDAPSPSIWSVPSWLHPMNGGTGMTYHPMDRWLECLKLHSAARGQEFVADVTDQAEPVSWAKGVIEQCR